MIADFLKRKHDPLCNEPRSRTVEGEVKIFGR